MVCSKGKFGGERVASCDYCNERAAILYCRPDSAKLCLICDRHVHSANDLSLKHLRSQICDNCASAPAAARCSTDNLLLCHDCDSDAHAGCAASAAHERAPLDGFSGCPSALHLASAWGLDLRDKKLMIPPPLDPWVYGSESELLNPLDLMVPNENAAIFSNVNIGEGMMRGSGPSICGKQKQEMLKQLLELFNRGSVGEDGCGVGGHGGRNLVPATPEGSFCEGDEGKESEVELGMGCDGDVGNQAPFASLLMTSNHGDSKESAPPPPPPPGIVKVDMLWDNGRNHQPPPNQVSFPNTILPVLELNL